MQVQVLASTLFCVIDWVRQCSSCTDRLCAFFFLTRSLPSAFLLFWESFREEQEEEPKSGLMSMSDDVIVSHVIRLSADRN